MIFELPSKDGNITPKKARKSRQMQLRDKTAYVRGLRYQWNPIKEAPSPLPALYATLEEIIFFSKTENDSNPNLMVPPAKKGKSEKEEDFNNFLKTTF